MMEKVFVIEYRIVEILAIEHISVELWYEYHVVLEMIICPVFSISSFTMH